MATKIIDVSKHNGTIDWTKVKASGISGVIIRAGYGRIITQKDKSFESFYAGAVKAGLNVGAYWYSYAKSAEEAKTEAAVFLEAIKGKKFDLPVYYDIEEQDHVALGKTVCTAMVEAFCSTMEAAGYFAGVYSFDSFFASNLDESVRKKYTLLTARATPLLRQVLQVQFSAVFQLSAMACLAAGITAIATVAVTAGTVMVIVARTRPLHVTKWDLP